MKRIVLFAVLLAAGCAAYTPPLSVPYDQLATVTAGGRAIRSTFNSTVRGGWYPLATLAEGGRPDHSSSSDSGAGNQGGK